MLVGYFAHSLVVSSMKSQNEDQFSPKSENFTPQSKPENFTNPKITQSDCRSPRSDYDSGHEMNDSNPMGGSNDFRDDKIRPNSRYLKIKRTPGDDFEAQFVSVIDSSRLNKNNSPPPKRRKWTKAEEIQFYRLVMKYGEGNWSAIRSVCDFDGRTGVMLKDKWRTILQRRNKIRSLENVVREMKY